MALDPVTAGLSLGDAVVSLITKTLPSDEQRLLAFKARYPRIYARVRMHTLRQMLRYLRHHRAINVAEYVAFIGGGYTDADRAALVSMINAELGNGK